MDIQLENKIEKNEKKIQELEIELEKLDRDVDSFFCDLNVNAERLSTFSEDKNNFCKEDWKEMLTQRRELEERLQQRLQNIRNPLKTKRAYSSLNVPNHWLFVR